MMLSSELFWQAVTRYLDEGWIRPLDLAFTRFLADQDPNATPRVLLTALLTSHQLGRGHVCLDLSQTHADPERTLELPPDGKRNALAGPSQLLAGVPLTDWLTELSQSTLVDSGEGSAPLVLSHNRLYLRRYYDYECRVAGFITERLKPSFALPTDFGQLLAALFDPLKDDDELAKRMPHWQSIAAAVATRAGLTIISGGPGTGKTTTVVRLLALLQTIERRLGPEHKLRIALAAPTGKAAARLSESLSGTLSAIARGGIPELSPDLAGYLPSDVTTLHRLLGSRGDSRFFRHDETNPLHLDLLVVDEASMIDLEMMASLLAAMPTNARLVLLGDKDQLASVEAGSVLGDLCQHADKGRYQADTQGFVFNNTGYQIDEFVGPGSDLEQQIVMLRKSHRFGAQSGIGRLAHAVNRGDVDGAEACWQQGFNDLNRLAATRLDDAKFSRLILGQAPNEPLLTEHTSTDTLTSATTKASYCDYLKVIDQGPEADPEPWYDEVLSSFGRVQILCALRQGEWGVEGLNQRISSLLSAKGLINTEQSWYIGRPVIMTRNDYGLDLMNGDIGICLPKPSESNVEELTVVFAKPGGGFRLVNPSRLNDVETVFAMTVHKSQGSEFEHCIMVMPPRNSPVLSRELIYTAITRAKTCFSLVLPQPKVWQQALEQRTYRASGLVQRF